MPPPSDRGSTWRTCAACRTPLPCACAATSPAPRSSAATPSCSMRSPCALPVRALAHVEGLPGVAAVYPVATYHATADTVPALVGAVPLWGVDRSTAGQGIKVGIIDDGIDAGAPFLASAGLRAPTGFPRGQRRFTTGRVIVARSFAGGDAPARDHLAFDPSVSEHGTHVSGIVAGAYGTVARPGLGLPTVRGLSGVAPGAWLGNYRGLARGDHESGAIGSTVELAAAVESAVKDGMDVLNLSLGGPEIDCLGRCARAGADQRRARGRALGRRCGQRLRLARLRLDLLTRLDRGRDHRGGDVERARLRRHGQRARPGAAGARVVHGGAFARAARDPCARRASRASSARPPTASRATVAARDGSSALRAVVLLDRGRCGFGTKAINAHEAGALAVIVESDRPGPPFVVEEETDLPLLVVTDAVGKALRAYLAATPGAGAPGALHAGDRRGADARTRADGLLVRRPDAVRPAAQARRLRTRRGHSLVRPAGFAGLSGRLCVVGRHLDGRAGRDRCRRADAGPPSRVDSRADPLGPDRIRRAGLRRLERDGRRLAPAHRRRLRRCGGSGRAGPVRRPADARLRAAASRGFRHPSGEHQRRGRRRGPLAGRGRLARRSVRRRRADRSPGTLGAHRRRSPPARHADRCRRRAGG